MLRLIAILLLTVFASQTRAAVPCAEAPGCLIEDGRYMALAPSGWDERTPLTTVVFYHGWRESAEYVVADPLIRAFVERHNVLLIAPHGAGNTWSFPGSPGHWRDEFIFAKMLVDDVVTRFPAQRDRLVAAGFSQGGSMVWNLACFRPNLFAVFGAMAGGFWTPAPGSCAAEGANLIHIHGTRDGTVPMSGRVLRNGAYGQSDIRRDWALWLATDQCAPEVVEHRALGMRACDVWRSCAKGKRLAMCVHDSGHQIHESDLEALWAFVEQTLPSR